MPMLIMLDRELRVINGQYQCWETVSEGSPISPLFDSMDVLCCWLSENENKDITEKLTKDGWFHALMDGCPMIDMISKELKLSLKYLQSLD